MIHIPGKYKSYILIFTLLFTVIAVLLINHSGHYIYLNINDPDDRITQRTYSDYIAQNNTLYLPVIWQRESYIVLGIYRKHILWDNARIEEFLKKYPSYQHFFIFNKDGFPQNRLFLYIK